MTELVAVPDMYQLPGSPPSNIFTGYAIADSDGETPATVAVEWLRQMCDYTLHLDQYEPLLAPLGG